MQRQAVFFQCGVDDHLGQIVAVQVDELFFLGQAIDDRRRGMDPTGPQSRKQVFGKSAELDHSAKTVQLFQRRRRRCAMIKQAVGVVFDNGESVLFSQSEQFPPLSQIHHAAGRIFERRHGIEQFGPIADQIVFQHRQV